MAAPPLVLFDLDDTLCDYSGARIGRLRGAFALAFQRAGVNGQGLEQIVTESIAIHPHGSDHFAALLAENGVNNPDHALEARRWYHANRFLGLVLYPGAMDLLHRVRALAGVERIGIITNGPAEVQRDKLDVLELRPAIDFAVISGEFGAEKPDLRIFAEALRLGQCPAEEAIYIGDSPEFDMDGAFNAGISRVWMNPEQRPWTGHSPPPKDQIRQIRELLPLLSR